MLDDDGAHTPPRPEAVGAPGSWGTSELLARLGRGESTLPAASQVGAGTTEPSVATSTSASSPYTASASWAFSRRPVAFGLLPRVYGAFRNTSQWRSLGQPWG